MIAPTMPPSPPSSSTTTTTTPKNLSVSETPAQPAHQPLPLQQIQKEKNIVALQMCMVGMVTGMTMMMPQNQPMAAEIMPTATPAQVGFVLARASSFGSLFEFLLNPLMNALGDKYGRRPIFVFSFSALAVLRAVAYFKRKSLSMLSLNLILTRGLDTIIFTNIRASLTDMLSGEDIAFAGPRLAAAAGVAVIVGPPVSLGITRLTGSHTLPLVAASCVAAYCAFTCCSKLEETLLPKNAKELSLTAASPLSFIELLRSSPAIAKLMTVSLIQTLFDGRNVADTDFAFQRSELGWSKEESGQFVIVAGFKILLGGIIGKQLIKYMGIRYITSWSNAVNCLASSLLVMAPTWSFYIMFVLAFGDRKRDGVESMLTDLGTEKGFGRGRIASALVNWRSIANMIAPLLFTNLYAWGVRQKKRTGNQYYASAHHISCCVLSVVAQLVYNRLSTREIDHALAASERIKAAKLKKD